MDLSKPQKALDISAERFGFLRKYIISKEVNPILSEPVSLDESKTRIFIHPKSNLNAGDIFHRSLYNSELAEAFTRKSFFEDVKEYFDNLQESQFLYGNALFSTSWMDKYYGRLFSFGEFEMPTNLDSKIDAGIKITRKFFAQAGVPEANRAIYIYVTRPEFKIIDKGFGELAEISYEQVVDTLHSEGWPVINRMPPDIPLDLKDLTQKILTLSNISTTPVGDYRKDALIVADFFIEKKIEGLVDWANQIKKILDKKMAGHSIFDPWSANYDKFDGPTLVEGFSRAYEWLEIFERKNKGTVIIGEKKI
jgi:hypothetical protein